MQGCVPERASNPAARGITVPSSPTLSSPRTTRLSTWAYTIVTTAFACPRRPATAIFGTRLGRLSTPRPDRRGSLRARAIRSRPVLGQAQNPGDQGPGSKAQGAGDGVQAAGVGAGP